MLRSSVYSEVLLILQSEIPLCQKLNPSVRDILPYFGCINLSHIYKQKAVYYRQKFQSQSRWAS